MKKLTLALVACMALGASAQVRHYLTRNGVVSISPEGTSQTRVVELAPVQVVPYATNPILVVPSHPMLRVPSGPTIILEDTANVEMLPAQDIDAYEDGHYDSQLDRWRYDRTGSPYR